MNDLVDKVESLIAYINDTFDIEDEDLKSDLDLLVNGESSSDLSLKTLVKYLNNESSVKDTYEDLFKVGDDNNAGIERGL